MTRQQLLDRVGEIVSHDRNATHGEPEDSFAIIAAYWDSYLLFRKAGRLSSADVAVMMCLFKAARLTTNISNEENWIDMAGYAACGVEVATKDKDEEARKTNPHGNVVYVTETELQAISRDGGVIPDHILQRQNKPIR